MLTLYMSQLSFLVINVCNQGNTLRSPCTYSQYVIFITSVTMIERRLPNVMMYAHFIPFLSASLLSQFYALLEKLIVLDKCKKSPAFYKTECS